MTCHDLMSRAHRPRYEWQVEVQTRFWSTSGSWERRQGYEISRSSLESRRCNRRQDSTGSQTLDDVLCAKSSARHFYRKDKKDIKLSKDRKWRRGHNFIRLRIDLRRRKRCQDSTGSEEEDDDVRTITSHREAYREDTRNVTTHPDRKYRVTTCVRYLRTVIYVQLDPSSFPINHFIWVHFRYRCNLFFYLIGTSCTRLSMDNHRSSSESNGHDVLFKNNYANQYIIIYVKIYIFF